MFCYFLIVQLLRTIRDERYLVGERLENYAVLQ
jgi:hypothetical protein